MWNVKRRHCMYTFSRRKIIAIASCVINTMRSYFLGWLQMEMFRASSENHQYILCWLDDVYISIEIQSCCSSLTVKMSNFEGIFFETVNGKLKTICNLKFRFFFELSINFLNMEIDTKTAWSMNKVTRPMSLIFYIKLTMIYWQYK